MHALLKSGRICNEVGRMREKQTIHPCTNTYINILFGFLNSLIKQFIEPEERRRKKTREQSYGNFSESAKLWPMNLNYHLDSPTIFIDSFSTSTVIV